MTNDEILKKLIDSKGDCRDAAGECWDCPLREAACDYSVILENFAITSKEDIPSQVGTGYDLFIVKCAKDWREKNKNESMVR